jgi:P pilus assembly chaperone PapD
VIFDGTQKAATVSVQNKDNVTNIVQSWIAVVDEASPAKDSFITTPPLFRLKAEKKGLCAFFAQVNRCPKSESRCFG